MTDEQVRSQALKFPENIFHFVVSYKILVLKGDKTIKSKLLGSGLPASFGAVTGYFVFDMTAVNRFSQEGKTCVLYKQYAAIDDSVDYTVRYNSLFLLMYLKI